MPMVDHVKKKAFLGQRDGQLLYQGDGGLLYHFSLTFRLCIATWVKHSQAGPAISVPISSLRCLLSLVSQMSIPKSHHTIGCCQTP